MHSFIKITALVLLLASASDAFSTAVLLAPPHQEILGVVASSPTAVQQNVALANIATSSSNLPSQRELFTSSSTTLLSAATAKQAAPAAPAAAAATSPSPGVMGTFAITGVNYDGKIPTTEADEYVVITNGSKSPVDASGYYVYVATTGTQGPTYTFPKGAASSSIIKPGASVRIYTNEIHKETGGYSFGSGKAIWNNRGGVAVLKDSNGKKLGVFSYKPPVAVVSAATKQTTKQTTKY
jgi:hypothetical protein